MAVAAAPVAATRTLACPGCGGSITLRAAGGTMTLACQYCGSLIDVANDDARLIALYQVAVAALAIPLGRRGTIEDVEWEAIGWMRRSEAGFGWEEYLLFNPYHGYRFLVTDGRGWTFARLLTTVPLSSGNDRVVEGQHYKAFYAAGKARVERMVGEFYWRVTIGETVETGDWVRPGFMLSREASDAEETWSLGQLLDNRLVRDQFGAAEPPAWVQGGRPAMPHQSGPLTGVIGKAWKLAAAALVALFVLPAFLGASGDAVTRELTLMPNGQESSITVGPVVLTRASQAVTISARAPDVRNQWVDLDYALVDRATQASYEAYGIAEEYEGRDSDGAWTEGSADPVTKMASVPAGTYDLVVDSGAHDWTGASGYSAGQSTAPIRVSVSVEPGATFVSNTVFAMLLVLGPLLWLSFRHLLFVSPRDGQSDFSASSSDDDDDNDFPGDDD